MTLPPKDVCLRALRTRDPALDGRIFVGVTSTGIYCRPICPARTPKPENILFFPSAAAAQEAGFRPCLRCRPEISPDAAAWRGTSNTVSRALALIGEGLLDGESGVEALADRLGVGERQLRRLFDQHLGAPPIAVAQTRRILFAKQLIQDTRLSMTDVAAASGFGSVRRFNALFKARYGLNPGAIRRTSTTANGLTCQLDFRPPLAWESLLTYLRLRAIPGVESVDATHYRRTVAIGEHQGFIGVSLARSRTALDVEIAPSLAPVVGAVIVRVKHLFDLGAAPDAVSALLGEDPLLAGVVRRLPGLRVPGAFDGFELAVRAVLGQQVSVAGARTLAGRLVRAAGAQLPGPVLPLTHTFPSAAALGELARSAPHVFGVPAARRRTLASLADAVAAGELELDAGTDPEELARRLRAIDGIGPWTVAYVALRVVGDPDAFPAEDLGVRRALARLGETGDPRAVAERWRPWRAYAVAHLWNAPSPQSGAVEDRTVSVGSRTMRRAS
jgi:AraC family transcriptional regulator of adaptative response / DNA-3-methyladenine glycosylase II